MKLLLLLSSLFFMSSLSAQSSLDDPLQMKAEKVKEHRIRSIRCLSERSFMMDTITFSTTLDEKINHYDQSGHLVSHLKDDYDRNGLLIVAVHPAKYCIAVWSPQLNKKGNSYRSMTFLEQFTTDTENSIF